MPKWTDQQRDAIADRGHSLIVCAAAGSGKTAVLVERIVQLVREGCPIENMLVVTFTNAAAGEMRQRIGEALSRAAREEPALGEQVMALSRASISTLHRFCGSLLREHFQALAIDPGFRIGDEQECGVLSRQAMEDAIYSCYEVGSDAFLAADRCYAQEELGELALELHRFMMTRPDPWAFLARAQKTVRMTGEDFERSPAAGLLADFARRKLLRLHESARETLALCEGENGPLHYAAACGTDVRLTADLAAAAAEGYTALHDALHGVTFAALGRKKKTDLFDEDIADRVKARRDALKKAVGELQTAFGLTMAEAAADIRMTAAPLDGLAELAKTYDTLYTAAKRQRGLMDFDDLEHSALAALELPEVRSALRERYRYVFIDEYQDSSAIQEAIVGSFAREDGLFLVGDVKQSIYRFRQAEPSLFLQKAARFDLPERELERRIDLQKNFRSRANVLEAANAVFGRIMRADETEIEYDEREKLFCGLPPREDDPPVELHILYQPGAETMQEGDEEGAERELAAVEREAKVVAARIHELVGTPFYDAKTETERPLRYRDMAVLMRAARGSAPLAAQMLESEGIPVFCDAGEGYFDIPEIRAMTALLQTIENGARDEPLLAALRGPALGLNESELAQIRIRTPDTKIPYYEAVRRYREEEEDALAEKLRAFEEKRARWRLCARNQGVDRLIERIYAETGFLAQAGALPGGASRQANLHLLTTRARAFVAAQGGSLHAFLRYAERLRAGGDSMSASAIGESEDVVRLMTTHKSKGLEFPAVILGGLSVNFNKKSRSSILVLDSSLGIGLKAARGSSRELNLYHSAIAERIWRREISERMRLLYVAMTRASEKLIMLCSFRDVEKGLGAGRIPVTPNTCSGAERFADWILPVLFSSPSGNPLREYLGMPPLSGHKTILCAIHPTLQISALGAALPREEYLAFTRQAIEDGPGEYAELFAWRYPYGADTVLPSKISVSQLIGNLPELGQYPDFMRDSMAERAVSRGTAAHKLMEHLPIAKHTFASVNACLKELTDRGTLTKKEAEGIYAANIVDFFSKGLGSRMLASPRVERELAFNHRVKANSVFDADTDETLLLQGIIDCCFIEGGEWVLIDYKTDYVPKGRAKEVAMSHAKQLRLYKSALEELTGIPVKECWIHLLSTGESVLVQ